MDAGGSTAGTKGFGSELGIFVRGALWAKHHNCKCTDPYTAFIVPHHKRALTKRRVPPLNGRNNNRHTPGSR